MLSHSKISTWKECRQLFRWHYDLGLSPIKPRPPLWRGKAVHDALAKFYSYRPEDRNQDILSACFEDSLFKQLEETEFLKGGELEQDNKDKFTKELEKGRIWLAKYWGKYGIDQQIPQAVTERRIEIDDPPFVAIPDAIVVIDCSDTWILEHKSGVTDIMNLALQDEQSLIYTWILRKLGYNAKGTIYNCIGNPTSVSDGLVREFVERTDNEIKQVEGEVRQIAWEIEFLPRYPHKQTSCSWCDFNELCRAESFGGDIQYLIETHFQIQRKGEPAIEAQDNAS